MKKRIEHLQLGGSRESLPVGQDASTTADGAMFALAAELGRADGQASPVSQHLWHVAKLSTIGALAASIAHELNNPLTTVGLWVEAITEDLPEHDSKRRPLAVIEQELDRMRTLVAGLLQFCRSSTPRMSTLDLREELEQALALCGHVLRRQSVDVVWDFAPDLPTVLADRQGIRQLLLNLLINASDSMPQGGTVTLRGRRVEREGRCAVAMEVSDTGGGIPADVLPKVMEPFFTTKEEGRGTGLGLPICHRVVQEHCGSLEISSEIDRGTTVRVVLWHEARQSEGNPTSTAEPAGRLDTPGSETDRHV